MSLFFEIEPSIYKEAIHKPCRIEAMNAKIDALNLNKPGILLFLLLMLNPQDINGSTRLIAKSTVVSSATKHVLLPKGSPNSCCFGLSITQSLALAAIRC